MINKILHMDNTPKLERYKFLLIRRIRHEPNLQGYMEQS